jgi:competence protein ComEC
MDRALNGNLRSECFFLDVGQGTGHLIHLGEGRVIVIDGGPVSASQVLLTLLADFKVRTIERLIVSHNDRDHCGATGEVLSKHHDKVRVLYLLIDRRDFPDNRFIQTVRFVDRERAKKRLPPLEKRWLGVDDPPRKATVIKPKVIFSDTHRNVRLEVLHPNFNTVFDALIGSEGSNPSSAVLRLRCGSRSIIFPGDAPLNAWEAIHRQMRKKTIRCDVLSVPHHGGVIWSSGTEARVSERLRWLYSEVIRCQYAVISAGTTNSEGHPRPECVRALREAIPGSNENPAVLCTQLTNQCCADPTQHLPGLVRPHPASMSSLPIGAGRAVACAGTIIAEIDPQKVVIHRLADHQSGVDRLVAAKARPLCRP